MVNPKVVIKKEPKRGGSPLPEPEHANQVQEASAADARGQEMSRLDSGGHSNHPVDSREDDAPVAQQNDSVSHSSIPWS